MKLYLVQHGIAVDKNVDPDRPLTDEGQKEVEKVAFFVKPMELRIESLWHSPKIRAVQTAKLIADILGIVNRTETQGLKPADEVKPIDKKIEKQNTDLMIVGHLPFLSKLASYLLTGNYEQSPVKFSKAGILCLTNEENVWQLEWYVTPQLLS